MNGTSKRSVNWKHLLCSEAQCTQGSSRPAYIVCGSNEWLTTHGCIRIFRAGETSEVVHASKPQAASGKKPHTRIFRQENPRPLRTSPAPRFPPWGVAFHTQGCPMCAAHHVALAALDLPPLATQQPPTAGPSRATHRSHRQPAPARNACPKGNAPRRTRASLLTCAESTNISLAALCSATGLGR
jgi:hypothetical protein